MKNLRLKTQNSRLMYYIIILFISLAFCTLSLEPAFASQTSGTMTVTVFVQGTFGLMVNSDSFDFARLMPGETGEMFRAEGINVSGASSNGNPWYLKVSTVKPLSSGSDYIPNDNFTWYGSSEGKGTWYGSNEKSLADPYDTAYISIPEEAELADRITNRFKFRLFVPNDTKPGNYTTTVMFTMTE
jgi:hypothetical protein